MDVKPPRPLMASVVLITYNHARFIARALESIFEQDVDFDFEVIVIDDCSTDQTLDVVTGFQNKYKNIRIEKNEKNLFMTLDCFKAVELAFTSKAQGKYIFELERDDFWVNPFKMRRQVAFMEANPRVGFCFHEWIHVDSDGKSLQVAMPAAWRKSYRAEELASFEYAWILWGSCCVRNTCSRWPIEASLSISLDMFIPYIYGSEGGAAFLEDCGPLAYRQNVGVWSTATSKQKTERKVVTALAIVLLLARAGRWKGVQRQVMQRLLPALVNVGVLSVKS